MLRELIPTLTQPRSGPCVSLYLHRTPEHHHEERLRLQAVCDQARILLASQASDTQLGQLIPALEGIRDAPAFRQGVRSDAAAFLAPGFCQVVEVPHPVTDHASVTSAFDIRALLAPPSVHRFSVLTVHADHVSIHEGDGRTLMPSAVRLPDFDRASTHDFSRDLANSPHPSAVETPIARDHSSARGSGDDAHERIRSYYHVVAGCFRAAHPHLHQPVVLAGTSRNVALFRAAARGVLDIHVDAVTIDPDGVSIDEFRHRVLDTITPYLAASWRDAIARIHNRQATLPIERDLRTIIDAAAQGQVDTLLIAREQHVWGRVTAGKLLAPPHPVAAPGDEDLLNLAAIEVLRHRGNAYEVDAKDLEPGCKVVALLRFRAERQPAEPPPRFGQGAAS